MPTLTVEVIPTSDRDGFYVRCPNFPAWRPDPVEHVDRPAMEKRLRQHQTKVTKFQWWSYE